MESSSGGGRPKQFGVTDPRSCDGPTAAELESTRKLVEVLHQSQKSAEESDMQAKALDKLNKIVQDWVKELASGKIKEANAIFYAFGSYILQVDEFGDAIDTICIGPSFVDHQHGFFDVLHGKLMNEVTQLKSVPDAHVPFMEFKLDGVPIKLVYASLSYSIIPPNLDVHQGDVLSNMDDMSRNSLNGCRVTTKIQELVPCNETFTRTLRTVKYWAKARGIWSNVIGFLGDCDWAILVARICQAHPYATLSTIVIQFFTIFSKWFWPNPVMLCLIEEDPLLRCPVWHHVKNKKDYCDLMPIISPAFPCKNIRADASVSTLRDMKKHFKCGHDQCERIKMDNNWADLFKPFKFFEEYMRYLHIDLMADNEEDLRAWKRIAESELVPLISKIEAGSGQLICHVCPIEHLRADSCSFFIGLSSERRRIRSIQFAEEFPSGVLEEFTRRMNDQKRPGMELQLDQLRKRQMVSHKWGKSSTPIIL